MKIGKKKKKWVKFFFLKAHNIFFIMYIYTDMVALQDVHEFNCKTPSKK